MAKKNKTAAAGGGSFVSHLVELRDRLLRGLAAVLAFFFDCRAVCQ